MKNSKVRMFNVESDEQLTENVDSAMELFRSSENKIMVVAATTPKGESKTIVVSDDDTGLMYSLISALKAVLENRHNDADNITDLAELLPEEIRTAMLNATKTAIFLGRIIRECEPKDISRALGNDMKKMEALISLLESLSQTEKMLMIADMVEEELKNKEENGPDFDVINPNKPV